jgi:phage-related minor tail protein
MMNIQKDIPPVTLVGGPRTGGGSGNEAFVNAVFAFAFGGLYGLASDLF